jgi:RNA polymerase sigma-70 factor (ECF subfamily)
MSRNTSQLAILRQSASASPAWLGGTRCLTARPAATTSLAGVGARCAATSQAPDGAEGQASVEALSQAFESFVQAYESRIYNVIFRLIDDHQEAEDLAQDTFVSAFRAFRRFRGEASVYTWLYRIAVNRTKNRLKQIGRQRTTEALSLDNPVDIGDERLERQVEDWTAAPERVLENKELGAYLRKCVRALPPDFKAVVVLCDYEGLSYKEIADVEGCSVKAVKSRLFRARSILRDKLRRYRRGEV